MAFHQRQGVRTTLTLARKHRLILSAPEFRVAASGMAWKAEETENVTAMSSTDIKWAGWLRVARGFQLRVGMKDRRREVFDGFERDVSLPQCERSAIFP
jgi:hypothetical protein